jgi:hypothetical protein
MTHMVLLAQEDNTLWGFWKSPSSGAGQITLFVGVLALITVVAFIWAAFWRTPRRRKHSYHHHGTDDSNGGLPRRRKRKSALFRALRRKRRHRHRRPPDRPLNPTLAQVGSLPPPRRGPPPGA